jgi:molybdopterin molybdotransferase
MALRFQEARALVLQHSKPIKEAEPISALDSAGRILAEEIRADRDYPPFHRAARDGFAVRAKDLPGTLRVLGEVRAGDLFHGSVGEREAVEIMTGAPLPAGADAVLMVEHVIRDGSQIHTAQVHQSGDNFTPAGSEAARGSVLLRPGHRLDFASVAALAMTGRERVKVYKRVRVAVLPTGDELVDVGQTPEVFQIRNSNAWSLAAQVHRAGGVAEILPPARDNYDSTRSLIERGLQADLLLLSGGVSAGKYDIVEQVLKDLGAEFYFDRVKIQPGQPVVFGTAGGKLFFGLPGNPGSTMVTFEIFARAALERLSGASETPLPFLRTRLAKDFRHKTGLTRFLPARLSEDGSTVEPLNSKGSGDIPSLALANAFLVVDADRESWKAGDDIQILLK